MMHATSGGMLLYLRVGDPPDDTTPPTGSVVINSGAVITSSPDVTLALSATDLDNAVSNMQFSWDGTTWLGWEAYTTAHNISIPAGPDGTKTIYVQFRDAEGNVSLTYSDSIKFVASPVVINNGAATTNSRSVVLKFRATSTEGKVTKMRLSWNNGKIWSRWKPYTAKAASKIPKGVDGTKTISVQFRDAAGNVSPAFTDSIMLDRVGPTGELVINGGDASTFNRDVTLTFIATRCRPKCGGAGLMQRGGPGWIMPLRRTPV